MADIDLSMSRDNASLLADALAHILDRLASTTIARVVPDEIDCLAGFKAELDAKLVEHDEAEGDGWEAWLSRTAYDRATA